MSDRTLATFIAPSDVNRADRESVVREKDSPHLETFRLRMKEMYRSMNTHDIAQVLHVPEAQVYRAVFGTRAALLQRNAGAIGFPQAKQEIKS